MASLAVPAEHSSVSSVVTCQCHTMVKVVMIFQR